MVDFCFMMSCCGCIAWGLCFDVRGVAALYAFYCVELRYGACYLPCCVLCFAVVLLRLLFVIVCSRCDLCCRAIVM